MKFKKEGITKINYKNKKGYSITLFIKEIDDYKTTFLNENRYGKYTKFIAELMLKNKNLNNAYQIKDNITTIYLVYNKNLYKVFIDKEDTEKVVKFHWFIQNDPTKDLFYVRSSSNELKDKKQTSLHRFIMNCDDYEINKLQIDHKNHNGLDCRKKNLRLVSNKLNQQNIHFKSNNTSGYIGVRFNKNINCWQAQWVDKITNKRKIKSFNIKKYGEEKAKQLAIDRKSVV